MIHKCIQHYDKKLCLLLKVKPLPQHMHSKIVLVQILYAIKRMSLRSVGAKLHFFLAISNAHKINRNQMKALISEGCVLSLPRTYLNQYH